MAAPSENPTDKSAAASEAKPEQATQQKPTAALEEDDEFEDFPVEGMFRYPDLELSALPATNPSFHGVHPPPPLPIPVSQCSTLPLSPHLMSSIPL